MSQTEKSLVGWYLDRANDFYRHMRWGLEALPYFDSDVPAEKHFGLDTKFVSVGTGDPGGAIIPVLPWGAHQVPQAC